MSLAKAAVRNKANRDVGLRFFGAVFRASANCTSVCEKPAAKRIGKSLAVGVPVYVADRYDRVELCKLRKKKQAVGRCARIV